MTTDRPAFLSQPPAQAQDMTTGLSNLRRRSRLLGEQHARHAHGRSQRSPPRTCHIQGPSAVTQVNSAYRPSTLAGVPFKVARAGRPTARTVAKPYL
eukprot:5478026-Amphidinium_carterae.1